MFDFVSLPSKALACENCKTDMVGQSHIDLAIETCSNIFDNCEPDWQKHFDRFIVYAAKVYQTKFSRGTSVLKAYGWIGMAKSWMLENTLSRIKL